MTNDGFCYYYPVRSAILYPRVYFASLSALWTPSWMIEDWQQSAYFSRATTCLQSALVCFLRVIWYWFWLESFMALLNYYNYIWIDFKFWLEHWYKISSTLGTLNKLHCLHLVDGIWLCINDYDHLRRYYFILTATKPLFGGYVLLTLIGWACMMNDGFC